jgi:hypothetical protein
MVLNLSSIAPEMQGRIREVVLAEKPPPNLASPFQGMDRERFALASLSHIVNHSAVGYTPLPDFREEATDGSIREPIYDNPMDYSEKKSKKQRKKDKKREKKELTGFYDSSDSDSDSSDSDDDSDKSSSSSSSDSDSSKESDDSDKSSKDSDSDSDDSDKPPAKKAAPAKKKAKQSSSSSDSDSDSDSDSSDEPPKKAAVKAKAKKSAKKDSVSSLIDLDDFAPTPSKQSSQKKGSSLDPMSLLDDLGSLSIPSGPAVVPTVGTMPMMGLQRTSSGSMPAPAAILLASPQPSQPLLHYANSGGLDIEYTFVREPSIYQSSMNVIRLAMTNRKDSTITNIKIGKTKLDTGMKLEPFVEIAQLTAGQRTEVNVHIDFNQKAAPAKFEIWTNFGQFAASLQPNVGELVRPVSISEDDFKQLEAKLGGMHESSTSCQLSEPIASQCDQIKDRVMRCVNSHPVLVDAAAGVFKFSAVSLTGGVDLIISINVDVATGKTKCKVNSELTLLVYKIAEELKKAVQGQ